MGGQLKGRGIVESHTNKVGLTVLSINLFKLSWCLYKQFLVREDATIKQWKCEIELVKTPLFYHYLINISKN